MRGKSGTSSEKKPMFAAHVGHRQVLEGGDVALADPQLADVGPAQRGRDVRERRFPRAPPALDDDELPRPDLQAHLVEHLCGRRRAARSQEPEHAPMLAAPRGTSSFAYVYRRRRIAAASPSAPSHVAHAAPPPRAPRRIAGAPRGMQHGRRHDGQLVVGRRVRGIGGYRSPRRRPGSASLDALGFGGRVGTASVALDVRADVRRLRPAPRRRRRSPRRTASSRRSSWRRLT